MRLSSICFMGVGMTSVSREEPICFSMQTKRPAVKAVMIALKFKIFDKPTRITKLVTPE